MNVFLVASPLQMLNAIEARYHFNLRSEDCTLCIFQAGNAINQLQLAKVTNVNEWGQLYLVPMSAETKIGWLISLRYIKNILKSIGAIEYFFIGDYRFDLMQHFVNSCKFEKLYLLDDGNATINVFEKRKKGIDILKRGTNNSYKFFIKRLAGMNLKSITKMNYFTVYDLKSYAEVNIVKNNYNYLKSHVSNITKSNCVYFLGTEFEYCYKSPIVKNNIYIKYLERVIEYFRDQDLIYFSCRAEPADKLRFIADKLKLSVKRLDVPIEFYLINTSKVPKCISGFYSSAFANIKNIFGSDIEIVSFHIKNEFINPLYRDDIDNIYNFYKQHYFEHFDIIDLI